MADTSAHYSGEFVLTKSGNIDFGEIPEDIAKIIKRQAGKIRLRIGKQVNGEKDNFGECHINRETRLNQLNAIGYADARDAAEDISCFFVTQTMQQLIFVLSRILKTQKMISTT